MTRKPGRMPDSDEYRKAYKDMQDLIERVGPAEAVRLSAESGPRRGDYTEERRRLLEGLNLEDVMAEMYGTKGSHGRGKPSPRSSPLVFWVHRRLKAWEQDWRERFIRGYR